MDSLAHSGKGPIRILRYLSGYYLFCFVLSCFKNLVVLFQAHRRSLRCATIRRRPEQPSEEISR